MFSPAYFQFSSIQFSSVQFSSDQFRPVQFSSFQLLTILLLSHITIHFSSIQFRSVQFNSDQFNSVQFNSAVLCRREQALSSLQKFYNFFFLCVVEAKEQLRFPNQTLFQHAVCTGWFKPSTKHNCNEWQLVENDNKFKRKEMRYFDIVNSCIRWSDKIHANS